MTQQKVIVSPYLKTPPSQQQSWSSAVQVATTLCLSHSRPTPLDHRRFIPFQHHNLCVDTTTSTSLKHPWMLLFAPTKETSRHCSPISLHCCMTHGNTLGSFHCFVFPSVFYLLTLDVERM
jgi:hypothetical protein